jgi:Tol biopolymer transport system component
MKRLDASDKAILEIRWSPDGEWLSYMAGDEVRLANVETGETRIVGKGASPHITRSHGVIFERNDEIHIAEGSSEKIMFSKNDLVKDSPKREPTLSPDGKRLLFVVCNVYDKKSQSLNAYPYRHFIALSSSSGAKPRLTDEQWYGGYVSWFPDSSRFAHFEFDSTAGPQIHILKSDTLEKEGQVAGLYPSVSPDGTRIAARPRSGGSVVVYSSKGGWDDDAIETTVIKVPTNDTKRPSATPPMWLDNRLLVVVEAEAVFRVDIKKDKAEEMKKFPVPTFRRTPSMVPSPDRELVAMEVQGEDTFELRVGKSA